MKMKDVTKQDRPREKLGRYGPSKLKDEELLAIILGTGIKGVNVKELSRNILAKFKDDGISNATVKSLSSIPGLGTAKASQIVACFELGRRLLHGKQTTLIADPKDIWTMMADIRASRREHLVVFYLDGRSQQIQRETISIGSVNETMAHPREVFEQAIKVGAVSIVLAHNHPSGNNEPSGHDLDLTDKIREAGQLLDIELADHVIVTNDSWRSILTGKYGSGGS